MFGSSKSKNGSSVPKDMAHLTGLERARLERDAPAAPRYETPLPPQPREATAQKQPALPLKPAASAMPAASASGDTAHLHAGPGVALKGEIMGCDTLRVEGSVEGNAVARQLVICPGGSFLGTADIQEAEIEGKFEGTLNVSGRLFLRSTGRIAGTLSYGQIEVERGGEIVGDVLTNGKDGAAAKARLTDKTKAVPVAAPPAPAHPAAPPPSASKPSLFGRS